MYVFCLYGAKHELVFDVRRSSEYDCFNFIVGITNDDDKVTATRDAKRFPSTQSTLSMCVYSVLVNSDAHAQANEF